MNRAETEDQFHGVDADDGPGRKQAGQDCEGHPVGGVVERGYEHHRIGDIEVQVASWQPLCAVPQRSGHWQGHNREWLALDAGRP